MDVHGDDVDPDVSGSFDINPWFDSPGPLHSHNASPEIPRHTYRQDSTHISRCMLGDWSTSIYR